MSQTKTHGQVKNRANASKAKSLLGLPLWLALGLTLAGCGGEATTMVTPQSSYTTTTPYTDSYYTNPTANTGSHSTDYAYPDYSYLDTNLPVVEETPTPPTPSISSGVEVVLVSKDLPGILSWERCEAAITVRNHEDTAQQGYLLARFSLKGREVEMQYRVISLTAKGNQTFTMKSTVQADDVSLEYRTKLL